MSTTTTTRTDIHRPSAEEFDPEGYQWEGCFDLHPDSLDSLQTRMHAVIRLTNSGHRFSGVWGMGSCDHCGARVRYTALMSHPETKGMIWIGEQCLANRFGLSKSEFQKLRKAAALNAKRTKKADAIEALLNTSEDLRSAYEWGLSHDEACGMELVPISSGSPILMGKEWADCSSQEKQARRNRGWGIAHDISIKLRNFGSISSAQQAFLVKLWKEDAVKQAKMRAETARFEEGGDLTPCPSGRVEVTGTVLSTKLVESDFGTNVKMLVQDDRGFKIWGTRPGSLYGVEKGARVRFTARIDPSPDDKGFGTFSRPTKAEDLSEGVADEGQEARELEPVG